jgi:hypothetical protein
MDDALAPLDALRLIRPGRCHTPKPDAQAQRGRVGSAATTPSPLTQRRRGAAPLWPFLAASVTRARSPERSPSRFRKAAAARTLTIPIARYRPAVARSRYPRRRGSRAGRQRGTRSEIRHQQGELPRPPTGALIVLSESLAFPNLEGTRGTSGPPCSALVARLSPPAASFPRFRHHRVSPTWIARPRRGRCRIPANSQKEGAWRRALQNFECESDLHLPPRPAMRGKRA